MEKTDNEKERWKRQIFVARMGNTYYSSLGFLLEMFSNEAFSLEERFCDFFEDWCEKHDIEIFYGKKAFMNVYENFFIVNGKECIFV